ncbi:succinate-semialdehyde dehydrogenase [Rhodoblastus acidophilus]|uniref:Succinate-semialdehyde dehydrogenase n=1 Tax=Rhodoblastus acidophilus TaxID=1074 RepID=A0A6N8DJX2_RHOAC|nr:succinate-semialdehyde dehydrogenase/glutarate-semialdehyde dehydrogenase [Rhodoblastus acidophilus]MTV29483.1 succinate-semialdehyde dehydrogenase [Rhodoblastus acidophilus]
MRLNDSGLLRSQNLVNGDWRGEGVSEIRNPATGALLGKVPHGGAEQATAAVEAARAAQKGWAALSAKQRGAIMRRWFELILAAREDLALIMTSEQGKPLAEARGEIDYAASFIEFYAEEAKRIYGETIPSPWPDARIIVLRQPIGVMAAITPWNFPAAMITRKCAPALAAGCACVIKPAPETPLTALALAELAQRAGFPRGVLNFVTGDAAAIGQVFCEHEAVRFVGFTGSTEVGKLLMRQAASGVKKVGLELGGNAPFIVFDDADLDAAVAGAMLSKYRNMGQTCVCANRLYVQDAIYDAFAEKLSLAVSQLKVGDGAQEGVAQGPLINARALQKVEAHIADALSKGARVLTGGERHELGGTFFQPTVLADVTPDMVMAREETFGPVAPLFRFHDESDVIAQANATQYGLASYFYARDLGRVFRVAEALEYGMVCVNSGVLSTEVAPFGGVKQSGLGREGSRHGIEEFLELKYVLLGGLNAPVGATPAKVAPTEAATSTVAPAEAHPSEDAPASAAPVAFTPVKAPPEQPAQTQADPFQAEPVQAPTPDLEKAESTPVEVAPQEPEPVQAAPAGTKPAEAAPPTPPAPLRLAPSLPKAKPMPRLPRVTDVEWPLPPEPKDDD